jgi:hypothetical protein
MSAKRPALACLFCTIVAIASGCGSTVRQATKEATPAAVQASVQEVHKPGTREKVAEVLADPEIRASTATLSQAVADGVLNAFTEKERVDRALAAGDAFLLHMNRSFARSLEQDLSPAVATLAATSVRRTLEELKGDQPALKQAIGEAAREAGRQAALGFQDAVVQADTRQRRGEARPGEVLASVGRASDAVLHTTSILLWALCATVLLAVAAGMTWLGVRLRHERSLNRDLQRRLVH